MSYLSEKTPGYNALPTTESAEPVTRPARQSWFSFNRSQWLLILIALYAVGLMGFDAYSRMEELGEDRVKGLCPAQPKALGKGPGWVSESCSRVYTFLLMLVLACIRKLHRTRDRSSLASRSDCRTSPPPS